MLIVICIYLVLYATIFVIDGVLNLLAYKSNKAIFVVKYSPFIRASEYLAGIFLVAIIESGIALTGMLTFGFVGYTTIILAICAVVYMAEFLYNQYKLKGYVMILPQLAKADVKALEGTKQVMGDTYIKADSRIIEELQPSTQGLKQRKKSAIVMFVIAAIMIIMMIVIIVLNQVV